jgi:hypothetical protein
MEKNNLKSQKNWFEDIRFVSIVKKNLPKLFKLAEKESMRGGKMGMEVGTLRERILVSCFIKSFGYENVTADFSVSENSKDVKVFDDVLSIKTFSNNGYGGLKVFWASDNKSVDKAINNYKPQHNLLITQIFWGKKAGGVYFIPLSVQNEYFQKYQVNNYLKKNKGNNRGISFNKEILISMMNNQKTTKIDIDWFTDDEHVNIYERWINKMT